MIMMKKLTSTVLQITIMTVELTVMSIPQEKVTLK